MTDEFDHIYNLWLEDDKIFLRASDKNCLPEERIVVRTLAILDRNGDLTLDGDGRQFKGVKPLNIIPKNCKNMVFFCLKENIVIFDRTHLDSYVKLKTSDPDLCASLDTSFTERYGELLPRGEKDCIVMMFSGEDYEIAALVGHPKDIERFTSLLAQETKTSIVYDHPPKFFHE